MSIIGDIYEEEIWETSKRLKEKLLKIEAMLIDKLGEDNTGLVWGILQEFKETFKTEMQHGV